MPDEMKPKWKNPRRTIQIDPRLHKVLKAYANRYGHDITWVAEKALKRFFDEEADARRTESA